MKLKCPVCWKKLKAKRPRQPCVLVRCPACGAEWGVWRDGFIGPAEIQAEGEWLHELYKRSKN